jgi:hypothetical protein
VRRFPGGLSKKSDGTGDWIAVMTDKPAPGSLAWKAGRAAAREYQATYVAERFSIPFEEARAFVERFGVERRELNRAVAEHLARRD